MGRSLELHPERVVEEAIKGMMPHNKLSRASAKKLRVFAGPEHPYAAQKPENLRDQAGGPVTEPNNTENLAADAADIAAAQAATEEFTNTIADAVAVEVEEEAVVPAPAELDQPIQTVGRRKRAIVRVRMTAGTGRDHLSTVVPWKITSRTSCTSS